MNDPVYNGIGKSYNSTRKADPFLADRLYSMLEPKNGLSTGNYMEAMINKGVNVVGINPSDMMLQSAKEKIPEAIFARGSAESIPFRANHFGGAIAVLTVQHWSNMKENSNSTIIIITNKCAFTLHHPQYIAN
jgi:uncharacterized Rossmann fold enzyme